MLRHFMQIFLLVVPALLCSACGDDDDSGSTSTSATLSVSSESLSFDYLADTKTLTIQANREWTAIVSDNWIEIDPTYSLTSSTTMSVSVTDNISAHERTSTITIMCGSLRQEVTITQAADPTASEISCFLDGYSLVWNDEFEDGTTLGSDWTHEVQNAGWVNNELQNYVNGTADGRRVSELVDGKLVITCFKGSDNKIYSARVYAKVNTGWRYGYFEARILLPQGKGTWPAWWMMPANNDFTTNPWPNCGEIDIMEEVGADANYVSSTIHCEAYNNGGTAKEHAEKYIDTAETDYHNYGCEWTADYIKFYYDEELILTYTNDGAGNRTWPFSVAFYPILNLAWGGDWGGYKGVDENALPATMKIDYVRIFQKQ